MQAESLTIGERMGRDVTLPISVNTPGGRDVQGFVLSVGVNPAMATIADVRAAGATVANNAELVVVEVLPGEGFTLGVVMDFDFPYDGQVIAGTGADKLIAEVDLSSAVTAPIPCGETREVPIPFVDGLNSPPLNNILVIDGMSIGVDENLVLNDGKMTIPGGCDELIVEDATGGAGDTRVGVTVAVDNTRPVEGYVICLAHPTEIALETISTGGTDAGAVGIEFSVSKIYPDGGTLGVVFDFDPPYDGQTLPVNGTHSLAVFTYNHAPFECGDATGADVRAYPLELVDNVFGSPLLSNVLVQGGISVSPTLVDGSVTFRCQEPGGITYGVGQDTGGDDPDLVCAKGTAGTDAKVSFYYKSDFEPIQGMSMAVTFPSELHVTDLNGDGQGVVQEKHIDTTITQGINAEFVSFNADNEAGELVIGILVDSTPPIPINHMYPPRTTWGKVLNVFFFIPPGVPCDTAYPIVFTNGITGAGVVPISNRAAVFNESLPVRTEDGCLVVGGRSAEFLRGDCNTDQTVDVADPAATMSYLFLGVYHPSCLDACDSNDDGVVDLADVTASLRFLFKLGPILPPPGPFVPGPDPTPDIYGLDLGCESGDPCFGL